jgi:hypothetical protein
MDQCYEIKETFSVKDIFSDWQKYTQKSDLRVSSFKIQLSCQYEANGLNHQDLGFIIEKEDEINS